MFGNLGKMIRMAGELKTKLPELKAKLAESAYCADAGGGAVSATVNGKLQVIELKIDPTVLDDDSVDPEMLGDIIKSAITAAQSQATDAAEEAMNELTGGMDLGGMGDMLGQ